MTTEEPFLSDGFIRIEKAAEHNLKNISLKIPRNRLVIITGLSGSGKSSLAFDTIYAEGQRRYVESLSTYARQFMDSMQKPEVESISGLTPTIAISQRTGKSTPRSTLATTTEIYDYLRVFFAKAGEAHCHLCQRPIASQSAESIVDSLMELPPASKIQIFAPVVRARKGEHKETFLQAKRDGFTRMRVDGEIYPLEEIPSLDKKFAHSLDILIDRIVLKENSRERLNEAIELALKVGPGLVNALVQKPNSKTAEEKMFSNRFACPVHGPVLEEMSPRAFSFNSPFGACEECSGLGYLPELDEDLMIPNPDLSLADGAVLVWKRCGSGMRSFYPNSVRKLAQIFEISIDAPWKQIDEKTRGRILHGWGKKYEGMIPNLNRRFKETTSEGQKARIHEFMGTHTCPACKGARLKPQILAVTIMDKSISDLTALTISQAFDFFEKLKLNSEGSLIAEPIKKAITERLQFLKNVGLEYLNLNRATNSLSGGEAQRIRLAGQVGSQLAGVTYVLDEPTIGLHQRDNERLLKTLQSLRDVGNSVLVVEHDEDIIRNADYLFDLGPEAGVHGGQIVAQGNYEEFLKQDSITARYLNGKEQIEVPKKRRKFNSKNCITISGCRENNLKNINVKFPRELFIAVTGVSGSGKSSLVNHCLLKGLKREIGKQKDVPGKFRSISGIKNISKVLEIDQSPIGRTSRSNPVTYTGCFDAIRKVFEAAPEAKARGYTASRFSFNVSGGRCESCTGQGTKTIEMHFLPDVNVECDQCKGKRYNKETLQVLFRGKNISDVLEMTIEEALEFFKYHEMIKNPLQVLYDVGLGYIHLGQPSTTLSGGEAQRIKLATEIAKRSQGDSIYIMDEPTTGLHFHDIRKLLAIIQRLTEQGNTIVVIEHNLDVIKTADWIIDIGPEGGERGGTVVAQGSPEEVAESDIGHTSKYLKKLLEN